MYASPAGEIIMFLLQREHAFNKLLPHKGTAHVKQLIYYLQFVMHVSHKADCVFLKGKKRYDVKINRTYNHLTLCLSMLRVH